MSKLHSFKRNLNAKYVQIAEAKAYDQAQAEKALAQERKENDSKLVQEVLEVDGEVEKIQKVDFDKGPNPKDFEEKIDDYKSILIVIDR